MPLVPSRALFSLACLALAGVVLGAWAIVPTEGVAPSPSKLTIPTTDESLHPDAFGGAIRRPVRGDRFPEGVLALTWDDGPDAGTLDLAKYLHTQKVAATFFVVGAWVDGVSEEPGVGTNVWSTGYRHMPGVLGDLVSLGHRVGGHTENHVLLSEISSTSARAQVDESLHAIAPFIRNELRMFRAPGGAWSRDAAWALSSSSSSSSSSSTATNNNDDLVGPIGWDIDAKDWDGSLHCRGGGSSASSSKDQENDCEPGPIAGETRVRPEVIARRYLAQIEATHRGIVLLHDRVGHVGSTYALDVARHLLPQLASRRYVFAAPVLAFSSLTKRDGVVVVPPSRVASMMADLDGDGRMDTCSKDDASGIVRCALATTAGSFAPVSDWSLAGDFAETGEVSLADLNGDGRADACAVSRRDGVLCALSDGHAFKHASVWSTRTADTIHLMDINGDGRADLCTAATIEKDRTECGLAP